MITLERVKKSVFDFRGAKVTVTYNVPTAEDAWTKIRGNKDLSDISIFKDFVESVQSIDVQGWANGVTAEEVCSAPGTFALVSKVALEIINNSFLTEDEKN